MIESPLPLRSRTELEPRQNWLLSHGIAWLWMARKGLASEVSFVEVGWQSMGMQISLGTLVHLSSLQYSERRKALFIQCTTFVLHLLTSWMSHRMEFWSFPDLVLSSCGKWFWQSFFSIYEKVVSAVSSQFLAVCSTTTTMVTFYQLHKY